MIKVLHILNTSSYSGAENVAITIISKMSENISSCYASFDGLIKDKLIENSIEFKTIYKLNVIEVRRLIKEFNPDIIHAHDFRTSVIAAFSTNKVPIISHLHNNSPWLKTLNLYSLIYLIATFKIKKILCVSESIIQEYIFSFFIKNKMINISNPIDLNKIKTQSQEHQEGLKSYDIAFIGRLSTPKDPLSFIELIKLVKQKIPEITAVMIGEGVLMNDCQQKIKEMELIENIELVGFLNNPLPLLSKSKLLCMTSTWEGFGLVAIEALALGIPVVAKPVGGLIEIITDDTGLLSNNKDELVFEIIKLIKSAEYRHSKSTGALKRSQEFSNLNSYTMKLEKIYKEVI